MPPSLISRLRSWRVAVLLDDEDAVVLGDEVEHLVGERKAAHAQGVEMRCRALPAARAPRPWPALVEPK